eukprot:10521766-Ditylum_brightwellii.AAC.1
MSIQAVDKMDTMNTGNEVIHVSCSANLEFDAVVDHCDRVLSQNSNISGSMSAKALKDKKARKTMIRKNTRKRPEDKPKRPLSAYNFFFRHEREQTIMNIAAAEGFDPKEVLKEIRIASSDEMKKRRRHRRKFYREIGFAALTKQIAAKWKALDNAAKIPFETMAMKEKQRYRNAICDWNEEQKMKNQEVD